MMSLKTLLFDARVTGQDIAAIDVLLQAGYSLNRARVATSATATDSDRCQVRAAEREERAQADRVRRIATCEAITRRFAGRADLTRAALHDPVALAELEARLGISTAAAVITAKYDAATEALRTLHPRAASRDRLIAASLAGRGTLASRYYGALGELDSSEIALYRRAASETCQAIDDLRARRRANRPSIAPLSSPAVERYLREQLAKVSSGLRTARHDHTDDVAVVTVGSERATSDTGTEWASEAGMSKAYQRAAYRVAYSRHTWRISVALLSVPQDRRIVNGKIYLSPTCRVRQGRGTALVIERLDTSGKRAVWR